MCFQVGKYIILNSDDLRLGGRGTCGQVLVKALVFVFGGSPSVSNCDLLLKFANHKSVQ